MVLFDRFPPGFIGTAVTTDNAEASFEATNHLIGLGHRRIAVIAGTEGISTSEERVESFRRAMYKADLTVRQEYVKRGDFNMKDGWKGAFELMRLPSPPTAIFSQLRNAPRSHASLFGIRRTLSATS
jgi:DNA-binding LacI/PurR family transcriptional regulator